MEVILLERVSKLGQIGDTVKVKDGFARNFLLPNGKALRATEANKKKFETLTPEKQKIIRTAMSNAIAWQRSISAKADADALVQLQKNGMTYSELPASERDAMKKATAHVVDDVKKRLGAPFVDQVLAELKKAGG